MRTKGCDIDAIAAKLPRHTPKAVARRISHLIEHGRTLAQRAPWTAGEDTLVCELRAQRMSAKAIAAQLPNRTLPAVQERIVHLRSTGRVRDLRVVPPKPRRWTDQEESLIIAMRERGASRDEIAKKLPHRTHAAVQARVTELIGAEEIAPSPRAARDHRPWATEEDELLEALRARKTAAEIGELLDRPVFSVSSRIAQRVLKGELAARPLRRWSTDEAKQLAALLRARKTAAQIADALDRPIRSVTNRIAWSRRKVRKRLKA